MKRFFSNLIAKVQKSGRGDPLDLLVPRRNPDRSRRFVPHLEALEDRSLPSVFIPMSWDKHPSPLDGGAAMQTGSLLTVDLRNKVNQPALNTVPVVDDGAGDIQVSWDGGPIHSFAGITSIVINSAPTGTEEVTFELTGPLTVPLDVQLNLNGKNNCVAGAHAPPGGLTFDIVTLRHNGTTEVLA